MDNLKQAQKRPFQYWFEDGINEIGVGLLFILLGLYFFVGTILPEKNMLKTILESSFILVILVGSWLLRKGISYFKENVTYPRTGYVSYARKRKLPPWMAGVVAGLAGFSIAYILIQGNLIQWLPAITGIILCLVMIFMAVRTDLLRFYLLALVALSIGIVISLGNIESTRGFSVLYTLFGFAILLSGAFSLIKYLNRTRLEEKSIDE